MLIADADAPLNERLQNAVDLNVGDRVRENLCGEALALIKELEAAVGGPAPKSTATEEPPMSLQANGSDDHAAAIPVANSTRERASATFESGLRQFAAMQADNAELKQQVTELIAALDESRSTNKRLEGELTTCGKDRDRYMRQATEAITSLNNAQSVLAAAAESARAA